MIEELLDSQQLQYFCAATAAQESLLMEELWDAPKALLLSLAQSSTKKSLLILAGEAKEENRLYEDLKFFSEKNIFDFPAWETLPSEKVAPSPDVVGERYEVLRQLIADPSPKIVISSLQACLQKLLPPSSFKDLYLSLKAGDSIPFEELCSRMETMGYQRSPVAADKGEFAIRGGIIDIYPVSSPEPYRLEFWGDEIESIRIYDPVSQKTVNTAEEVSLTPAQEMELIDRKDDLCTILDYIGKDCIVVFDGLLAIEDRYAQLKNIPGTISRSFLGLEEFLNEAEQKQAIYFAQERVDTLCEIQILKDKSSHLPKTRSAYPIRFEALQRRLEARRFLHPFQSLQTLCQTSTLEAEEVSGEELLFSLSYLKGQNIRLDFLCHTETEKKHLQQQIAELGIELPKQTRYLNAYLSSGFYLSDQRHAVFPLTEITHRYRIRRQKQRTIYHSVPSEVYELDPGDTVVHMHNGIGTFRGVEKKQTPLGSEAEFFRIEYANQAQLFVPLTHAHLISKYVGAGSESPKMHKLGSKRWQNTRVQTEQAIMGYASDLLRAEAAREVVGGFEYPSDSEELRQFEEEFPFVETEDQLAAMADIKADMCSSKAMNRLVCGDVGFGKTEVAIRSACKTVIDGGMQVAVLVPTTMLAMQHYETFVDRMRHFPIRIEVISRFRTTKQIKAALEGAEKGSVDILIGTHRIISKDVGFKKLGLVIIDEEQRFGVRAKEHLKKLRTGVDCLTLSATPIPRTLYMALVGVRDMSIINTPPQDRLPIHTVIAAEDDAIVYNALLRELNRDGQAYYIHNRVDTIFDAAARIQKMLPQAKIVVGHGQMTSSDLDRVFHQFKSGEADILVATTIVESGIDIPNANTILVERADTFGLADLHQLRGRVGRWNRKAYAYLLTPKRRRLSEIGHKRLMALVESGSFGGGYKIAMRDLEIRGAGDILGVEQSGQVSSVGFHLYCKMLKRTIKTLQGKLPPVVVDCKIEFPFDARLPEEYVNESSLRMAFYQRFGDAWTLEEVDAIWEEVQDRFGKAPEPVKWLYYLTRIRVLASRNGFTLLKWTKVSFLADRRDGRETLSKKTLLKQPQSPIDMEKKVQDALKKMFGMKDFH